MNVDLPEHRLRGLFVDQNIDQFSGEQHDAEVDLLSQGVHPVLETRGDVQRLKPVHDSSQLSFCS